MDYKKNSTAHSNIKHKKRREKISVYRPVENDACKYNKSNIIILSDRMRTQYIEINRPQQRRDSSAAIKVTIAKLDVFICPRTLDSETLLFSDW